MPCRSDYMEATPLEVEMSIVLALLEELKTGKLPDYYNHGEDHRVYGCSTKTMLDEKTAELCKKLRTTARIYKLSLELQVWWRNHQEFDRRRMRQEVLALGTEADRRIALKKLTPKERRLLGI